MSTEPDRLPPGRQPYDSLNGMRVGALAGGVVGAVVAVLLHGAWPFVVGAVVGGAAGFWSERRKLRSDSDRPEADP